MDLGSILMIIIFLPMGIFVIGVIIVSIIETILKEYICWINNMETLKYTPVHKVYYDQYNNLVEKLITCKIAEMSFKNLIRLSKTSGNIQIESYKDHIYPYYEKLDNTRIYIKFSYFDYYAFMKFYYEEKKKAPLKEIIKDIEERKEVTTDEHADNSALYH